MIAVTLRILAIALVLPLLAAGGLYLWSPVQSLDVLDRLYPGDGGVVRMAEGVPFAAGPRGRLDVWAGPQRDGARRPVLVFFYGGGWVGGRRQDYGFAARAYAAQGLIVVVPDYRLVPAVRFPAFVEDAAAAVRWTHDNIAHYGGDPERIAVAGHSAGAYLAIMLALDQRYLTHAGVSPDVVRAAVGLAGPYDFHPFDQKLSIDAMGQAPDPLATQPVTFARADAPPLWLATGTADTQVRPRNATRLARRQREAGSTTTELRLYPGRSHDDLVMALSRPFRSRAPVLSESVAFLNRVMPPADPVADDRSASGRRPDGTLAWSAGIRNAPVEPDRGSGRLLVDATSPPGGNFHTRMPGPGGSPRG